MNDSPDPPSRSAPSRGELADTRIVIGGGGTAGHVLPGISIAQALVGRGVPATNIHFVGAVRGIEARIVPEAGFEITLLPGRGIQRRLTLENLRSLGALLSAVLKAFGLVRRQKPAAVLGLGGFASAACSFAAVMLRVPLVIAEQNARAGAVNRLVGRFARACAVPFADVDLPKRVVTGNPVRDAIIEAAGGLSVEEARSELGLPRDRKVVLVFAGSLGSSRINEAVYGAVEKWRERSDLAIYHVVGARDWESRPNLDPGELHYQTVRYEDRMEVALRAADLAVCRAGGTTVAELAVMGLPAVLVPLPIATRDHQTFNAEELVSVGGAVRVPDSEFDTDRMVDEVEAVLPNIATMSQSVASIARPDAADHVADLILANMGR